MIRSCTRMLTRSCKSCWLMLLSVCKSELNAAMRSWMAASTITTPMTVRVGRRSDPHSSGMTSTIWSGAWRRWIKMARTMALIRSLAV